jgi:hypothetical protein
VNIRTKRWKSFSESTIRLRDALRRVINQSTPVRDGQLSYAKGEGSDSVIDLQNQRVLKLITPVWPPDKKFDILFGVSVDTPGFPEDLRSRSEGFVGIKNRVFEIVGIMERDFTADALAELVRDTLANIIITADGLSSSKTVCGPKIIEKTRRSSGTRDPLCAPDAEHGSRRGRRRAMHGPAGCNSGASAEAVRSHCGLCLRSVCAGLPEPIAGSSPPVTDRRFAGLRQKPLSAVQTLRLINTYRCKSLGIC